MSEPGDLHDIPDDGIEILLSSIAPRIAMRIRDSHPVLRRIAMTDTEIEHLAKLVADDLRSEIDYSTTVDELIRILRIAYSEIRKRPCERLLGP